MQKRHTRNHPKKAKKAIYDILPKHPDSSNDSLAKIKMSNFRARLLLLLRINLRGNICICIHYITFNNKGLTVSWNLWLVQQIISIHYNT